MADMLGTKRRRRALVVGAALLLGGGVAVGSGTVFAADPAQEACASLDNALENNQNILAAQEQATPADEAQAAMFAANAEKLKAANADLQAQREAKGCDAGDENEQDADANVVQNQGGSGDENEQDADANVVQNQGGGGEENEQDAEANVVQNQGGGGDENEQETEANVVQNQGGGGDENESDIVINVVQNQSGSGDENSQDVVINVVQNQGGSAGGGSGSVQENKDAMCTALGDALAAGDTELARQLQEQMGADGSVSFQGNLSSADGAVEQMQGTWQAGACTWSTP